jgi:energy-coupling factor transporter transmembrane protein EcfT
VNIEGTDRAALAPFADDTASSAPPPGSSRRVEWVFYALLGAATLSLFYVASLPGSPLVFVVPVLGLWFIVGVVWLVRLVSAIQRRSFNASLIVGPVIVVAAAALVLSSWPLQARFDLGRSSFDATVRSLPADQFEGGSLGEVGTYRIKRWSRSGDAVLLYASRGTGLVDNAGFAFSPNGVPEALRNPDDPGFEVMGWQDLGGGWYAWQASW